MTITSILSRSLLAVGAAAASAAAEQLAGMGDSTLRRFAGDQLLARPPALRTSLIRTPALAAGEVQP